MKAVFLVVLLKGNKQYIASVCDTLNEAKYLKKELVYFLNRDTKVKIIEKGVKI